MGDAMESLSFFDANASFGRRSFRQPGSFTEKSELLRQMERFRIRKALVWHSLAKEYDPAAGNEVLLQETADHPALIPLLTVLPHYTGEFPPPEQLAAYLRKSHIRAVTMFPSLANHGFGLSELSCGVLFDMLETYRIPLFLSLDQTGGLEAFGSLVLRRPKLRLVLTNVNFRVERELYPILAQCENVWVETSGYRPFCGLEEACRRFGAERFVFGSGMPTVSAASSVSLLTYADISQADKCKIAFQNLDRLFEEVRL